MQRPGKIVWAWRGGGQLGVRIFWGIRWIWRKMLDTSLDARSGTPVVPHTEVGGAGTGLRCECPGGAVASACALLASGVHACASIFVRASLSASAGTLRDRSRMAGGGGCRFMLFIRQSCSSSSWVETLLLGSSETCVACVGCGRKSQALIICSSRSLDLFSGFLDSS